MTFTEAAAQVLRLVGKPLHYKEITDVAIEKNLLSHVGKSPEVTMGARLAALVKKGDKDNPLVRIKPGVFALREWDQGTIEQGLADRTPALERIAANGDVEPEPEAEEDAEAEGEEPRASGEFDDEEAPPPAEDELRRAQFAARATELFAAEEDDDEPIFGSTEDEEEDAERPEQQGARRRRRRRRRGRGPESDAGGDDLPSYTVSDAPADLIEAEAGGEGREPREPREAREPREQREPREAREPREPREQREQREQREPREPRESREPRERFGQDRRDSRDRDSMPDELGGRDLADAAQAALSSFDRNAGPVGLHRLAEAIQRRGRLTGDAQQAAALIGAAVRADNLRRQAQGQRQRFRVAGNRVALTDWLLDGEMLRLERELSSTLDRYREAMRRSLLRRLQELPHRALGELMLLLLERVGMTQLSLLRRPGSHGAELHLSARLRGPAGEIPTAVIIRRDGREIGRERVTELRGALHHYGPAVAGWLITTGQALSGAREEAAAPGAAPVTLIDGLALAKLCEEHGVGVTETRVSLPLPDADLLDSLRAG